MFYYYKYICFINICIVHEIHVHKIQCKQIETTIQISVSVKQTEVKTLAIRIIKAKG